MAKKKTKAQKVTGIAPGDTDPMLLHKYFKSRNAKGKSK